MRYAIDPLIRPFDSAELAPVPSGETLPALTEGDSSVTEPRRLTPAQVRAIRAGITLFREDDLTSLRERPPQRWCARCEAHRPSAGFIAYGDGALCNPCAIDYELARASGHAESIWEFRALDWDMDLTRGDGRGRRSRLDRTVQD